MRGKNLSFTPPAIIHTLRALHDKARAEGGVEVVREKAVLCAVSGVTCPDLLPILDARDGPIHNLV